MFFNERLKVLREDKDLTQDELSKILHIERKTLSNYETAYRTPNIYIISKMADFFGVSVDYLLCRTDIPTPYPKRKK